MDWSQHFIPAMRLEPRFGDRIVPAFCERPKNIPAMVAEAVAQNGDGEALVCGATRMTWREVAQESAQIAAGFISSRVPRTGVKDARVIAVEAIVGRSERIDQIQ